MIRVAYGSVPKDGGTFTFYRNQRSALRELGVDMRCVSVGAEDAALWQSEFADDGCVLLANRAWSIKRQAQAFVRWCECEQIDIVIGINSCAILSGLPHLPERTRAVARCANAFDKGYRVTIACYERLARIIALTPRLRDDLVCNYGVEPDRIKLIPNGITPIPFEDGAASVRGQHPVLRLGFLGRLEHGQKGVMFLPDILQRLRSKQVPFRLRIAGKGVHELQLRESLAEDTADGSVEFVGAISPAEVPGFLAKTDVFVFPSQFEGCPNALLEAMMAGAAPVCWKIQGITDFIVDSPDLGTLCDFGDCEQFADGIAELHHNRDRLSRIAQSVGRVARARFTDSCCAESYATLFRHVMDEAPPAWTPRPWSRFRVDPAFDTTGWRRLIGRPLRQFVKRFYR